MKKIMIGIIAGCLLMFPQLVSAAEAVPMTAMALLPFSVSMKNQLRSQKSP